MKLKSLLTTATLSMLAACSNGDADMQQRPDEGRDNRQTEVLIGLPAEITRTEVGDDGSARWSDGDTFALWAAENGGEEDAQPATALENQIFTLWHYNADYNQAFFTTTMTAMNEGLYDYYAVSPAPQTAEGTKVSFTLPQEQDGRSTLTADIMTAGPVTAGALCEGRNTLGLEFRHMMHAMKITIPEGGNLMRRSITALNVTFPTEVAGTVTFDVTNPQAGPVLTEGSKTVTVRFDEPKQSGDSFWITIFPARLEGEVSYVAEAGDYKSKSNSFRIERECKAGHVTPVSLMIPRMDATTRIVFSVGENFLGEEIDSFTVADEEGKQHFRFDYDESNRYEYVSEEIEEEPEYSGKVLTVEFDSQHAKVQQKIQMPQVKPYTETVVTPLRVPYILEEDFSQAASGENRDEYATSDQNVTGQSLDNLMPAAGWSAARYKISGGNAIRINYRFESVSSLINGRYGGRLDTPALTALKPGAKIKVQFDAGAYVASNSYDEDKTTPKTYLQCTVHTNSGVQNGSTSTSISNTVYTSPDYFANDYTDDSFDSDFPTYEFTVDNCSPASRIAWWPRSTRTSGSGIGNSIFYVYIDNIKISIAQ